MNDILEVKENILDYQIYSKIRKSIGWNNFSEIQVKKALKNNKYDVVVFYEEEPVGMGRVIGDGLYYTIVDVIVIKEFQGNGIGSSIIDRIMSYVNQNVPSLGKASVQLIAEKGKEGFYEIKGFEKIPNNDCGFGMHKIIRNN